MAGGQTNAVEATSSVEIYDPATNTWSVATSMPMARRQSAGALLGNGKILVGDGVDANLSALSSYITYDPSTDTWASATQPPAQPLQLTSLLDGRVLGSCKYLYDPATDTWSAAPYADAQGGDLFPDGAVFCGSGIYDPVTDTWTPVAPGGAGGAPPGWACSGAPWVIDVSDSRLVQTALSDGRWVRIEGREQTCVTQRKNHDTNYVLPKVYDPAQKTWKIGWDQPDSHEYMGGGALANGTVMLLFL